MDEVDLQISGNMNLTVTPFSINDILNRKNCDSDVLDTQDGVLDMSKASHLSNKGKILVYPKTVRSI